LSKLTEVEVLHDSVGEFVEFLLVNMTWVLGVNSLSSLLNPSPLFCGNGMIKGSSDLLNTDFDFIVGEGSTIVGIKSRETFSSESFGDTFSSFSINFDGRSAPEKCGDSVRSCPRNRGYV
jgi:hypothetical protein